MDYEKTYVQDVYNTIASEFDVTRTYHWSWINDFICSIDKGSLIYDIGCGNGRNMTYPCHRFIGIDACDKFVDICRKKNLEAYPGKMTEIPFPDKSADHIICIATFHHLYTYDNRITALREMKRVLKPGGKILLSVWSKAQPSKTRVTFDKYGNNLVPWKKKLTRFYYIFEIDEIKSLFKETGLNIQTHLYDCGNEVFVLTESD